MATIEQTISHIVKAPSWDRRVARIRQIPGRHGTDEHPAIYAEIARRLYVAHLAPDYAYVPVEDFYERPHFDRFAGATAMVAKALGLRALSASKVDSMERSGTATSDDQAWLAAETIDQIMHGTLFGRSPTPSLKAKQDKPDTASGWESVRRYAEHGVPYSVLLHQRHYGGAFRQVLDATSERRGNLIEDAVEALLAAHGLLDIRTGAHHQAEITARFEVTVQPAPDFVIYDESGSLRAMLECKGANDGGTDSLRPPLARGGQGPARVSGRGQPFLFDRPACGSSG